MPRPHAPRFRDMALVRRAARLHRRGLQAPEIAARLLVSLQTAQQLIEQATRGEPAPPADAAEAEAEPAAPPSAPTPAERGCVYIDGDGPFADRDPFCGKPAMRGMPYCAEHAARCYRAARRAAALRELAAAE